MVSRTWISLLSLLPLLLCVAAAVAIGWGGYRLGTNEVTHREEPDREPLKAFAESLRQECDRLDRLFESHLRGIAKVEDIDDDFSVRALADRIVGIRQVSVLHPPAEAKKDRHIRIQRLQEGDQSLPLPYVQGQESSKARLPATVLAMPLAERLFFEKSGAGEGWKDAPGKPMLFWHKRNNRQIVVFTIDPIQVREAMVGWVDENLGSSFSPANHSAWKSPGGQWLTDDVSPNGRKPDFILPVQTRFGSWELVSWDQILKVNEYDAALLAGASSLAIVLCLSGLFAFVIQRRSIRNAQQRVSFVNRVSHELRTPLTNIQLNADLAGERLGAHAPEAMRRIELVHSESQRLGRLIDNVLTFSRCERHQLELNPAPAVPDAIVSDVLEQFAPALQRRGFEVIREGCAAATEVMIDGDALAQILANLISNVEKYAANGKLLKIAMERSDGFLEITVSDAGPGIAPRDRRRIFQPFKRLSASSREGATGTGLGMTIALELARAMGGDLQLSNAKVGAHFHLKIPAASVEDDVSGHQANISVEVCKQR